MIYISHEILLSFLVILYLSECTLFVSHDAFVFSNSFGLNWKLSHILPILGNDKKGALFRNPLPPLGTIYIANHIPFSFSRDGFLTSSLSNSGNTGQVPENISSFLWEDIKSIDFENGNLKVNNIIVIPSHKENILECYKILNQIHQTDYDQRNIEIRKILNDSLSDKNCAGYFQALNSQTINLKILLNIEWFFLFTVIPIFIVFFTLTDIVFLLIACYFLIHGSSVVVFSRLFNRLQNNISTWDKVFTIIKMIVSPISLLRSHDLITSNIKLEFHPLTVAKTLIEREKYLELVRKFVKDIQFPIGLSRLSKDQKEISSEFRKLSLESVNLFLKDDEEASEYVFGPKNKTDNTALYFCKRCEQEFITNQTFCSDCFDVGLEKY